MPSHIDALRLRAVMGRDEWAVPEPFGPDGWRMLTREGTASLIATYFDWPDETDGTLTHWIHASMTRPESVPSYDDLCRMKRAVWGDTGHAYQFFVAASDHYNHHPYALHLWGRADGARLMPDFVGALGSI